MMLVSRYALQDTLTQKQKSLMHERAQKARFSSCLFFQSLLNAPFFEVDLPPGRLFFPLFCQINQWWIYIYRNVHVELV